MADEINDLRLLVQLVSSAGVTKAAITLNSSPAAVSRRLTALENRLGVRLIDRHARRFRLTEEGALLHERALSILEQVDEVEAEISVGSQPSGRLRVCTPVHIGRTDIGPWVAQFTQRYPHVSVELVLTDAEVNLVEEEIDIVIGVGEPDSQSVVRRSLLVNRRVIVASPDYLQRKGAPRVPEDLLKHDCLLLVRGRRVFDRWRFVEDGKAYELQVRGRMLTNSSEVTHQWALSGYGIAVKMLYDITEDLAAGRLVECLPEFASDGIDLYICYAARRHLPGRARVFIDFLVEAMARRALSS
ncbi:LysR family transcriptional regulator [Pseudomonas gingeri]|uniref:LysR family transcriptional regulator n=1 Tax=Pseudomonas gingeri TaxID=117681 RepID=UPI0015A4AA23|nr:LysR family transcriptional regulator [Pseudomonas gingeri]NVZ24685.1 LysR family transcriptional regulator [Pseudomonas gingeri]